MVKTNSFYGQKDYRVDAKGRVPFPSSWLTQMGLIPGECLMVAKGLSQDEKYLEIFSPVSWEMQVDKISNKLPEGNVKNSFVRWYVSTAESVEIDKHNRVRLPKGLMEWAGVKKDISFLGTLGTIQLWSQELLSSTTQFNPEELDAIFDLFNVKKNNPEGE